MIDRDDFLGRVADILEVPAVTPELEFRSVPGWGSMMGFALYIMLEDEYGVISIHLSVFWNGLVIIRQDNHSSGMGIDRIQKTPSMRL